MQRGVDRAPRARAARRCREAGGMSSATTCPNCETELVPSAVATLGAYCPKDGCGYRYGRSEPRPVNGNGGDPVPLSDAVATVQRSREQLFEECRPLACEDRILDRLRELLPTV